MVRNYLEKRILKLKDEKLKLNIPSCLDWDVKYLEEKIKYINLENHRFLKAVEEFEKDVNGYNLSSQIKPITVFF